MIVSRKALLNRALSFRCFDRSFQFEALNNIGTIIRSQRKTSSSKCRTKFEVALHRVCDIRHLLRF